MSQGPFGVQKRKQVLAQDLRLGSGPNAERLIARNGEINAFSKKELIQQQANLMQLANSHEIIRDSQLSAAEKKATLIERRQAVQAAFADPVKHKALGAAMGDELYTTQQREGIMRNILNLMEVTDGQQPTIKLRNRNILATFATGPTETQTQIVRDSYFYPREYYITARPYIEQAEIRRNNTDILEDKFMEATQAFLVQEDRIFRDLCLKTVGQQNPFTTQVGSLNPTALATFRNQITRWNLSADIWLIANDLFIDLVSDAGFQVLFEPLAHHELILTGKLGTLLGMTIKSDGYRFPEHRVLHQGEMFIFSSPDTIGTYTDRGGIETLPIDAAVTMIPGRGWHMTAQQSQTIVNPRAVACGIRVNS